MPQPARKPRSAKHGSNKTTQSKSRTYRSIDEVRRTFYPKAHDRMVRDRSQTGIERLGLGWSQPSD